MKPKWFTLKSRRGGSKKKGGFVSGEIQLQFAIVDTHNPSATPEEILRKFISVTAISREEEKYEEALDLFQMQNPDGRDDDEEDEEEDEEDEETPDETEDPTKPEVIEKKKKRLRLKKLKRKTKARAYEFSGGTDCIGILFLHIEKVTDLPPERNGKCFVAVPMRY